MTQSCKDVLEALIDTALSKAMKVGELTGSSASGSEIAAAKVELQSIRCAVIDSVEQQINIEWWSAFWRWTNTAQDKGTMSDQ